MSIEILDGLKRQAKFTISKKEIDNSTKLELQKYAKTAKAPGFRTGKLPNQMVEQMYGGEAYQNALNKHIHKEFANLIATYDIDIADYPKFDLVNQEDHNAEEFIFTALFEVMPEIKLNDFSTCEIEKPTCTLDESTVDKTIEALRKQHATYSDSDKVADSNDKVTIDFIGTLNGVAFDGGSATDYQIILGQGHMLPDFENAIFGLKVGETKSVEVNFPETYQSENLKGKTATFTITLKKVQEASIPELDNEFIKSIGVNDGTVETLQKEVRANLEHELNRRIQAKTRENILTAILKNNPIEVPYTFVHDEIHRMMDNTKESMKKQGYPEDKIKLTHDMFEHDAKRFVMLKFLIQEFIKENDISVNDDEIRAIVQDMATVYEDPQEYIQWYYSDEKRIDHARATAIENKVMETVLSQAKVINNTINYDELIKMPL